MMQEQNIIAGKYRLSGMIGSGCFGCIMKGTNVRTKEEVAVKIEKASAPMKLLKRETQIYILLSKQHSTGFPTIKTFGKDGDLFYMVMELLGASLSSFKHANAQDLSLPASMVRKVGIQIIDRLQQLHATGLIHRDIKPDNLLFGIGRKSHIVHLIDFGFCKSYLLPDGSHVPQEGGKTIVGTMNFISVNMHDGSSLSRRDDIESAVYVMIYLFLPLNKWETLFPKGLNELEVKEAKLLLLYNDTVMPALIRLLRECKQMKYEGMPDYDGLKQILAQE
jgi:serine/threonine protein kinase